MKIISIFVAICVTLLSLCACSKQQELVDIKTVECDEYLAIEWEGRSYIPFCVVFKGDCGKQIGYINEDKDDRVCEYKELPDGLESEYDWNN